MRLRFTPKAVADIFAIAEYIGEHSPAASQRVRAAIYASLEQLLAFPLLGRAQKTVGVRRLVTRRYRYLVYYTVNEADDEIVILNVKHPAQDRVYEDG
jgi:toxin ParE1/3/4